MEKVTIIQGNDIHKLRIGKGKRKLKIQSDGETVQK